MIFVRLLLCIFVLFFVQILHADSTIKITLVNKSNYEFKEPKYTTCQNCRIKINTNELRPGNTAIIEATITADVDFDGNIYFNDNSDRLHIKVFRLKKTGQPSFKMHSQAVKSNVDQKSLRFNNDGVPTHLAYTAVTVYLE